MLRLVSVHDDATFCLQFPSACIYVEHDDIHAQVHGCLLGGQTGAQRVVEEDHHQGLVLAQMLIFVTVVLDLHCLGHCFLQWADILYINKCLHIL